MQARDLYALTATSHKNMLKRAKAWNVPQHPDFDEFVSFLAIVGPRPSPQHTLDRIDWKDKQYAPGKVRWLTTKEQNLNKGDTVFLTPSGLDGKAFTLEQVAGLQGKSKATIQKRRAEGWTDDEIWAGKKQSAPCASNCKNPLQDLKIEDFDDDDLITEAERNAIIETFPYNAFARNGELSGKGKWLLQQKLKPVLPERRKRVALYKAEVALLANPCEDAFMAFLEKLSEAADNDLDKVERALSRRLAKWWHVVRPQISDSWRNKLIDCLEDLLLRADHYFDEILPARGVVPTKYPTVDRPAYAPIYVRDYAPASNCPEDEDDKEYEGDSEPDSEDE